MFVFAEWSHQLQPMGLVHIIGIVSDLYNGSEYVVYEDEISSEDTLNFEFRIWVDRSYINNGHYHGVINVEEVE